MWYLYLDESGDLGFDFVNKHPSKFFTITILAVSSIESNRDIAKAVKITIRRKLNPKHHRRRMVEELKGTNTTLVIKKYWYTKLENKKFGIYSITLNKRRVFERLTKEKLRVYNWIARNVLDHIPFEKNHSERVQLIIDKSKGKPEIVEFNTYIRNQLHAKLDPKVPLDIYHMHSQETPGLQAVDLFCWGIFQKYERKNEDWYSVFKQKIRFDEPYL